MTKPDKDAAPIFIDSFELLEMAFAHTSVIGIVLCDSTAAPGEPAHRETPLRLRMSTARARAIGHALIATADELDGTGQTRQ